MVTSKTYGLKSIIQSSQGIHLTAYVPYSNQKVDFKKNIDKILHQAKEYLRPVMSKKEVNVFLDPIRKLIEDTPLLKQFNGNIGIFRTKNSVRFINIPIEVELTCVVATTFHVKPLLKWMQLGREYFFLGITKNYASLYFGDQSKWVHLYNAFYPDLKDESNVLKSKKKSLNHRNDDVNTKAIWLMGWLNENLPNNKTMVFLAGEKSIVDLHLKKLKHLNLYQKNILPSYDDSQLTEIRDLIKLTLQQEAKKRLEMSLIEFWQAQEINLGKNNIFQIAKAALMGKVKKLIIADEVKIFGKMNPSTGELKINPVALDHEDDDLLDDLAQTVLNYGGEVVIAKSDDIPKGRPVLAILENPELETNKNLSNELGVRNEKRNFMDHV